MIPTGRGRAVMTREIMRRKNAQSMGPLQLTVTVSCKGPIQWTYLKALLGIDTFE